MNDKELREIRRRFRPDKNNIMSITGIIVDGEKNITSRINQSMVSSSADDCEKILSVMKKAISGTVGTNLIDIEYSAKEVMESPHHAMLSELRNSHLNNNDALEAFYAAVIESVHMEGPYALLIANDTYDVFSYSKDGEKEQDSGEVFNYIVCCVCPIKPLKAGLYFNDFDSSFKSLTEHAMLSNPELGFMFPTFDDRAANIYKVQFYTKDASDIHPDFIETIFGTEVPMAPAEQKETFDSCLSEALTDECNFENVKSVHEQVSEMVTEHKESKEEEPLVLSKETFKTVLENCGIEDEKVEKFSDKFEEDFGNDGVPPQSIMEIKKFEVTTPYVSIKLDPERTDLISTQIINGTRYIMIRANDEVQVNGITVGD